MGASVLPHLTLAVIWPPAAIAGSVSKRTDCVALGAEAGFKTRKAAELCVETLSEQAWLDLIGGA